MDREPCPPEVPRTDVLGRLRRERWLADDAGEARRVAEIDARIARLSAGATATSPLKETAAARPAATTTTRPRAGRGARNVPPAR